MATNIPTIIPNANPDSFWASKVNQGVQSTTAIGNPDFRRSTDLAGVSLTMKRRNKPGNDFIRNGDEFDATLAYDIDEVIRVISGTTYLDVSGSAVSASVGTWRNCFPVPPASYSSHVGLPAAIQARYSRAGGVNYYPIDPEPGTVASPTNPNGRYWEKWSSASSGSGGSGKLYKIQTTGSNDYYFAAPFNGTIFDSSSLVQIAKPNDLRASITSDTVEGVTISYTYPSDGTRENNRTANDGTNTETECIYPRYKMNQVVIALQLTNGTDIPTVAWMEILPHRVWARRYGQT